MTKATLNSLEKLIHNNLFDWELFSHFKQEPIRNGLITSNTIERKLKFLKEGFETGKIVEVFRPETVSSILYFLKDVYNFSAKDQEKLYKYLSPKIIADSILEGVHVDKKITKDDLKFIQKLAPEMKNDFIFKAVSSGLDHSFKVSDYTANWNTLVEDMPFYFLFFKASNCTIDDFVKNSSKFDLTLKYKNQCFLTHCLNADASFINCALTSYSTKLLPLFPNADILDHIYSKADNAEKVFKKYWENNKVNKSSHHLMELLSPYLDLTNKKCFFLKEAEKICSTGEVFILDYFQFNEFAKPNLSFLADNFKFSLINEKYCNNTCRQIRFLHNSTIALPKEFSVMLHLIELEPQNALFIDLDILSSRVQRLKGTPTTNSKKVVKFYEKVKDLQNTLKIKDLTAAQNKKIQANIKNIAIPTLMKLRSSSKDEWAVNFGFKEALIKKLFYSKIITPLDIKFDLLEWSMAFKANNFNYDRLTSFINSYTDKTVKAKNCKDFINLLKNFYTEEKIFNIILNSKKYDAQYIDDTIYALNQIKDEPDLVKIFKKKTSNNIKQVHDNATDMLDFVDQVNFELNQEKIKILENLTVSGLKIQIPRMSHDLIKIGEELNICVGNGEYAIDVRQGYISIITLNNSKDEVVYCIELDDLRESYSGFDAINQAKGFNNANMSRALCKELENILEKHIIVVEEDEDDW